MKGTTRNWAPKGGLDTPYKRARQEWDERMGSAMVQAANWRLAMFAVLFFVALPSLIGLIYVATLPKLVPHIIDVEQDGRATYLGAIGRSWKEYTPSAALVKYQLRRFVEDTRSISSDRAVIKRNWLDAYRFLTPEGAEILNAYVEKHDPFLRAEKERVSVEVLSMVQISEQSWQVDWQESAWSAHGELLAESSWRGVFTIVFREPVDEEQMRVNPVGFYIKEFHWARINS